jgi:hypothetical protein
MMDNFLVSLKFYDRDHLSKSKVRRLEQIIRENSQFAGIETVSRAAVPLTMWLKALLNYHGVIMAVEPLKKELKTAEETLTNVSPLPSMNPLPPSSLHPLFLLTGCMESMVFPLPRDLEPVLPYFLPL